jgi:hypothetical protein
VPDVPTDAPLSTQDGETYVNAITTVVGEVGFHIDAQTRNALRQAFTAGIRYEQDIERGLSHEPRDPDFDEWLDQYIEDHDRITSSLDSVSQSERH